MGKRLLLQQLFDEYEIEFVAPAIYSSRSQSPLDVSNKADPFESASKEALLADIQEERTLIDREILQDLYVIKKSSVRRIQAMGKVCVIDLDWVKDAMKLKDKDFEANFLFVAPGSLELIEKFLESEVRSNPPLVSMPYTPKDQNITGSP